MKDEKEMLKRNAYVYLSYRNIEERNCWCERDKAALAIAVYDRGLDLTGTYIESGAYGWKNILPVMQCLLQAARNGKFGYLFVNRACALGSDGRTCIHTARLFAKADVSVISLDGERIFSDKATRTPEEVCALHIKRLQRPDL